jgi:hypothetical protein
MVTWQLDAWEVAEKDSGRMSGLYQRSRTG